MFDDHHSGQDLPQLAYQHDDLNVRRRGVPAVQHLGVTRDAVRREDHNSSDCVTASHRDFRIYS